MPVKIFLISYMLYAILYSFNCPLIFPIATHGKSHHFTHKYRPVQLWMSMSKNINFIFVTYLTQGYLNI